MSENTNSSKPNPLFPILGLIFLGLIVAGFIAYSNLKRSWSSPLGPALDLPTYTPAHTGAPTDPPRTSTSTLAGTGVPSSTQLSANISASATSNSSPTSALTPTASPAPLCGAPPLVFILGVGVDTEDNNYTYGLGDAIRVARIDFVNPKITVLSLPRDLWVDIPDISDHYGITSGKLNQSFLYGGAGMGYYDGPGNGAGLMARTLDQNMGLRLDHYGAVNMLTFERIIDAVGGIDLYLPTDVDGTAYKLRRENMGYFYGGQNHFNGDQALRFSRIRKGTGDFNRVDNQTLVLCALKEKLLNPSVVPKIPKIISAFQDSIVTDLSLEQMSQLACLLPHIERENLIFTSLPGEILETGWVYSQQMRENTFVVQADNQALRDTIDQFIAGAWPTQPKEPSCP